MRTLTDVGVLCDEPAIHDDRGQFNSQASSRRHAFTSVTSQIDEEPLDALGLDFDVDWRRRLRQFEFDVVSGHPLQNRLKVA